MTEREPIQIAESLLAKMLQRCPMLHLGKNAKDWDEVAAWLVEHGVSVAAPAMTEFEQQVADALLAELGKPDRVTFVGGDRAYAAHKLAPRVAAAIHTAAVVTADHAETGVPGEDVAYAEQRALAALRAEP